MLYTSKRDAGSLLPLFTADEDKNQSKRLKQCSQQQMESSNSAYPQA